ncbi:hypothetical protein [Thiomonas sp. X19]|uniref:hypothetical protein n=1 Tax=Thiomonas sp. X19 TaxID=1050370 RepID=UPI0013966806|nr:hypothetical protein [Thiomonas sp. X19]
MQQQQWWPAAADTACDARTAGLDANRMKILEHTQILSDAVLAGVEWVQMTPLPQSASDVDGFKAAWMR